MARAVVTRDILRVLPHGDEHVDHRTLTDKLKQVRVDAEFLDMLNARRHRSGEKGHDGFAA